MTLSYDISRCVGHAPLDQYSLCAERDTCQRYLQIARDSESGTPEYQPFRMMAMLRSRARCEYKIEVAE